MSLNTTHIRIGLVGCGMIGRAWATVFAKAGFQVTIWDPDREAAVVARQAMIEHLEDLDQSGLLSEAPPKLLDRINFSDSLSSAVCNASYVQENGPERLDDRRRLFAELDAATPADVPIASSTSGMRPSTFTHDLPGRHRCLVAHPANPPSLLPLIELCPSPWTSERCVQTARAILGLAGREIAELNHEIDGFILNRLQGALLAEAFRLVAAGTVCPDDVDKVVKHALGMRWSFMGPFETIDLNAPGGIADFCERYGRLYADLQEQMQPRAWDAGLIESVVANRRAVLPLENLSERQKWRDRRLMALASFMENQPSR